MQLFFCSCFLDVFLYRSLFAVLFLTFLLWSSFFGILYSLALFVWSYSLTLFLSRSFLSSFLFLFLDTPSLRLFFWNIFSWELFSKSFFLSSFCTIFLTFLFESPFLCSFFGLLTLVLYFGAYLNLRCPLVDVFFLSLLFSPFSLTVSIWRNFIDTLLFDYL